MAKIRIETVPGDDALRFRVTVKDGDGQTVHVVTTDPKTIERLGRGASPDEIIEASFRFLLDREAKESILGSFALTEISRHFPEYEERLAAYLG